MSGTEAPPPKVPLSSANSPGGDLPSRSLRRLRTSWQDLQEGSQSVSQKGVARHAIHLRRPQATKPPALPTRT